MVGAIEGAGAASGAALPPPSPPVQEVARALTAAHTSAHGMVDTQALARSVASTPGDKAQLAAAVTSGLDARDQASFVSELTVIAHRAAPAAPAASDDRPHSLWDHLKDAGGVLWGAVKDVGGLAVGVGRTASDLTLGPAVDTARAAAGLATGHTPEAPSWAPSAARGVQSVGGAGKTAWTAATHPAAVVDALKAPYQKDWAEGRWGALAAQTALDFGGLLDGESEALVGARVASAAEKTSEVTQDVSRGARAAERTQGALDGAEAATAAPKGADAATAAHAAPAASELVRSSAHIGKNTVQWTRNAEGLTVHTEADIREVYDSIPRSSAETKAQKAAADLGVAGDQGGHIVGHRFVKDQGGINMFPQNGNLNMGAYKTFENEVADWVKAGGEVKATFELVGPGDRPSRINVSYEVLNAKGEAVYDNAVSFRNQAGQSFDRVRAGDMTKLLNP